MNTGDPELEYTFYLAERRVLEIQAKLHRWAVDDPHRRFDDLFNLVADPAFLLVAWSRVRGNKGAKTAGVDGHSAASIQARGVGEFLGALRDSLRDRSFSPLPSRERLIPKPGTAKRRRLGISTIRDRVVQASLKLVLEPVFEADFLPCSYGFRPGRRVHDAVAEVRHLTSRSYEWIVEGDIKACFDEISHCALLDKVRARVGDKRVLALVKAFLKAGILTEDGTLKDTDTGTPQGSILSPLLSNVALSVLDEHFAQVPGGPASTSWGRAKRRRLGLPNCRLVRYADDWTIMVAGTRDDAVALREEAAQVLARTGLRLSEEKTLITHIDEGLDFLGGTSSATASGARTSTTSTPTRQGRRCAPPWRRSRRGAVRSIRTSRWTPCWHGSTRCCKGGQLSSPWSVERDLPVPQRLRLAPGGRMDPPQAPRDLAEGVPPPLLRRRMVAQGPGTGAVQRRAGHHDPVSLPGIGDPLTLAAGIGMRTRHRP